MPSAKTVTRTVRIDDDTDRLLGQLASRDRVSMNFLVNRALRRYAEWEAHAERFGFITIPATVHAKFYSYLSEDEARQLGHWVGENFLKDFVIFWYKKISLETVLEALRILGPEYARIFQLEHNFDGRTHTLVLKHGRGQKGSILNEEFLKTVFTGLLNRNIRTERTEDQVVAQFS